MHMPDRTKVMSHSGKLLWRPHFEADFLAAKKKARYRS